MQITRGRQNSPYKIVLYGVEGIGKTTFASQFPDPLFIDTEGSTARIDVARLDKPSSWSHLAEMINFVIKDKPCKTLVIDTADWAEVLAKDHVISSGGEKIKSIEDFGYGKGYTMIAEQYGRFLNKLTEVTNVGIHVVITAHAMMRKFEQPDEMGAYDRWELKLEKKVAPLVKEWADMILFANYKTMIIEDSKTKTKKGVGGQRIMYTTHHPAWDAKNRDGLPEELPFEFASIAHLFNQMPTRVESPAKKAMDTVLNRVNNKKPELPVPDPEPIQTVLSDDEPKLMAYPDSLPQKIVDLLKGVNVTADILMQAIGPSTNGGLGYFPGGMAVASVPDAFWDHVAANWKAEFKPIIENILMKIPF